MSIPGIGARTGARILTEIGDINRFPTPGHLAAYAGLAPVTPQSGRSINGETHSRRGNHRLKNAMCLSALCSLHHDRSRRDYYARKRSKGTLHNAAIMCLARRRCDVIHAMLRSGLSYGELPGPPRPSPNHRSHSPRDPLTKPSGHPGDITRCARPQQPLAATRPILHRCTCRKAGISLHAERAVAADDMEEHRSAVVDYRNRCGKRASHDARCALPPVVHRGSRWGVCRHARFNGNAALSNLSYSSQSSTT
jgi:hypothetical protein